MQMPTGPTPLFALRERSTEENFLISRRREIVRPKMLPGIVVFREFYYTMSTNEKKRHVFDINLEISRPDWAESVTKTASTIFTIVNRSFKSKCIPGMEFSSP